MENIDNLIMKLFSTLSRVNMLIGCLPSYVQDDMEEIKVDITSLLRGFGYNVCMANNDKTVMIDMVTLYGELNRISNDLANYILLTADNVKDNTLLEDAACNISLIMKTIAANDSVFRACYNEAKKRVLK